MAVTVVAYSLAMLGYTAELAYGRQRSRGTRSATCARTPHPERVSRTRVLVGAGGGTVTEPDDAVAAPALSVAGTDTGVWSRRWLPSELLGPVAVALTMLGWVLHAGEIVTRGMAAHRLPWGNMYEFASALAFSAVTVFLALLVRYRIRALGLFVLIPVVLQLEIASTLLYTSAGPLVPALQSHWIATHVTAAIIASGLFTVTTVTTVVYFLSTVTSGTRQRACL